MLPVLQVGPLAVQISGLVILIGLWIGLSLSERYAQRSGFIADSLYKLVFVILLAGLAGARLSYIIRYPSAFLSSPISTISLNPDLLDPWGGAAAGMVAALIYGQRKKLPFWETLDMFTPALGMLGIALALAHLASGSAFGAPSNVPWAIELWGTRRQPTQIYEIMGAALILAVIWLRQDRIGSRGYGVLFLTFLALSSALRLFLEAFRGDSSLLPDGIRSAQVIAWCVLAACLFALRKRTESRNDMSSELKSEKAEIHE
jgi:phosphatidylglycerol:prolipoprotein diacylglycerol transferase